MSSHSPVDVVVFLYLVWGFARGLRRDAGRELRALIQTALLLALLTGIGVLGWTRAILSEATRSLAATSGILGATLTFVGALWLLYLFRTRLPDFVQRRLSARSVRLWGAVLGLLRTMSIAIAILAMLSATSLDVIRRPVAEQSVSGRLVAGGLVRVGAYLQRFRH